jgi:hypothetical protein
MAVTGVKYSRAVWRSSHTFSDAITIATRYASAFSHAAFANCPIFTRSDVKRTSGNTANESCRLRITWLSTSSRAVPLSPYR